jgi:putative GTP pyrophosphokinase
VYRGSVGREPDPTRVEGLLNEAYAPLAGSVVLDVREFLVEKTFVIGKIKDRAQAKLLFRQPSILLVYMLVSRRPTDSWAAWPLTPAELKPIFTDLGESAAVG